uniref:uncharacterized protein LOC106997860 n=1 Tax=Macaca mulatta TaxID=9544 RepID=UPI000732B2C7|nr:uncharacterized protein LOC106997860 [Macaca mulatta]
MGIIIVHYFIGLMRGLNELMQVKTLGAVPALSKHQGNTPVPKPSLAQLEGKQGATLLFLISQGYTRGKPLAVTAAEELGWPARETSAGGPLDPSPLSFPTVEVPPDPTCSQTTRDPFARFLRRNRVSTFQNLQEHPPRSRGPVSPTHRPPPAQYPRHTPGRSRTWSGT